jgi:hypothetical protein
MGGGALNSHVCLAKGIVHATCQKKLHMADLVCPRAAKQAKDAKKYFKYFN